MSKAVTAVNDFTALPLRFRETRALSAAVTHYLYIRRHAPKIPTSDTVRELFLVNIPIDATAMHIRALFADQLGGVRVDRTKFDTARERKGINAPDVVANRSKKRKRTDIQADEEKQEVGILPVVWDRDVQRSGSTAVVTMVDQESAELAMREVLQAAKTRRRVTWGTGVDMQLPQLGMARYKTHHKLRFPELATLQASVDAFMAAFSKEEEIRARALARQRQQPDEDGFVTVVRGGRTAPAREEEVRRKAEELTERDKARVQQGFYRYQARERKKEAQKVLVKEFESDRKKLEEMRKRKGKLQPE